jgi:uncharacterized tellurite resistance protein B-like protein
MSLHTDSITRYVTDSPAAIARAVALTMMADASVHPKELDALDAIDLYAKLGLTREEFLGVASECFADAMLDMRARDRLTLLDDALVDRILADVQDPRARELAYRASVALLPADGRLNDSELAVLQRMLDTWRLPRATVEGVLS